MPMWTPKKRTHKYRVTIEVRGPKTEAKMKRFRKAVRSAAGSLGTRFKVSRKKPKSR